MSPDFPSFCAKVADTDAAALPHRDPRPFEAFELAVRKATGVRPTPLRWDVWMGPRFVWSRWNGTQGMCAHPGLLLRAVHAWRSLWGARPDAEGVYACAGQYYAWRDGFLLVSPSPEYVKAALDSPLVDQLHEGNDTSLLVQWNDGDLRVHRTGLPVEGTLNQALQSRANPRGWQTPAHDALLTWARPRRDALRLETAVRPFETNATDPLHSSVRVAGNVMGAGKPAATGRIGFLRRRDRRGHNRRRPRACMGVRMRPRWEAMRRRAAAPLRVDYAWEGRPGCVATLMESARPSVLQAMARSARNEPASPDELLTSEIRRPVPPMRAHHQLEVRRKTRDTLKKAGELRSSRDE